MFSSKLPYEAPALQHAGAVIATTEFGLVSNIEKDLTPRDAFGSVGFGV